MRDDSTHPRGTQVANQVQQEPANPKVVERLREDLRRVRQEHGGGRGTTAGQLWRHDASAGRVHPRGGLGQQARRRQLHRGRSTVM